MARIKLFFKLGLNKMTQVMNVLLIVLVTVFFSVIATLLTVLLDNTMDMRGIIASIPKLTLHKSLLNDIL